MIRREISDERIQIDSLDGLRGLAALLVVCSHTSSAKMFFFPSLNFEGVGKAGVFLFFLLSSFLLAQPLLEKGKKIFQIQEMAHYWQRRFFRIYPLYTLYLGLGLFSTFLVSKFLNLNDKGVPFYLDFAGFLRHLALQEGKGVTWSIAVEFKFYFILPFIAFLMSYIKKYGIIILSLSTLLIYVATQLFFPSSESLVNDARLMPYFPIFLFGVYMAAIQSYINNKVYSIDRYKIIFKLAGYLSLVLLVVTIPSVFSFLFKEVAGNYFHKNFVMFSILWGLVLFSAINIAGGLRDFFSSKILRFFGAISFSAYLLHIVFISCVRLLGLDGVLSAWMVLLLTIFFSYISFKVIEAPCSKIKISNGLLKRYEAWRN